MTPRKRLGIEKDPLYRNDHAFSLMKVDAEPLSCVKYHMECYFTPVTKTTSRPVPAGRQILRLSPEMMPRTIRRRLCWPLDPADSDQLMTLAGCFQFDEFSGKIQYGSASGAFCTILPEAR